MVQFLDTDDYEILGVPQGASMNQIKRSYRRLYLVHYPDKAEKDE